VQTPRPVLAVKQEIQPAPPAQHARMANTKMSAVGHHAYSARKVPRANWVITVMDTRLQ
jgi:hypothetical protein